MTASELSSINRANATHSTGPKTIEGKERTRMNALKHGLTGQRLVLQPEEYEAYRELHESLHAELEPKTTMELQLVQKIVDTQMRLNRVAVLDNNLLNFGLIENLSDGEQPDDTEIARAQARSWIAHEKSFEKLGRYEGRLSRQLLAYSKELDRLQSIRVEKEREWERARAQERIMSLRNGRAGALRAVAQTVAATAADPLSASFGSESPAPHSQRPDSVGPAPEPAAA